MTTPERPLDGLPASGAVLDGKYRIERVLGVGGMGAVLEATHLKLEEKVAIKVLLGDCLLYTSPSPRDRQKSRMPSSA